MGSPVIVMELKNSVASTLPDGVTIARRSTTSLAKDFGNIGFFLGVSLMKSADTSKRLLSMSSIVLLMWRKKIEIKCLILML